MPNADSVLIDTHVLLWWQGPSERLSTEAAHAIESAERVLVSPITSWEVATLVRKNRITLDRPTARWIADLLGEGGPARIAELTPSIAVEAGQNADLHGDPADRIIYATARLTSIPLVTKDSRLQMAAETDERVTVIW